MLRFRIPALAALLIVSPALRAQVTVTSEISGSVTPITTPGTESVANGGFLINPNLLAPFTGDGIDEATTWDCNLALDPSFAAFENSTDVLTDATLTLSLTQFFAEGPATDAVRPLDLGTAIEAPRFLAPGETGTIKFHLLEYYTPAQILGILDARVGMVPMIYSDDAVVSHAHLELTRGVPAPGAVALCVAGIVLSVKRARA